MTDEANKRADELHEAGMELSDAGDEDGAIQQYLKALLVDPDRPSTLYNLGLIYKYRREWQTSFGYNQRAREFAANLARGPTAALGYAKRLVTLSAQSSLETQMEHERRAIAACGRTADFREGTEAFIAKRPPDFQGR